MEAKIYKVISRSENITINAGGKEMTKCTIVLQELDRFGNTFMASMLGEDTKIYATAGDIVAAVLRFQVREYDGRQYQDIIVNAISRVGNITSF